MDKIAEIIQPDRAKYYDKTKFEQLFDKFDEDKNGFLSKGETA